MSAVPEGTAPAGGWPIYLSFVTDQSPVPGQTCGAGGGFVRKNITAFATPQDALSSCFNASAALIRDDCAAAMTTVCARTHTHAHTHTHHSFCFMHSHL
jgi:hypothetical protein